MNKKTGDNIARRENVDLAFFFKSVRQEKRIKPSCREKFVNSGALICFLSAKRVRRNQFVKVLPVLMRNAKLKRKLLKLERSFDLSHQDE